MPAALDILMFYVGLGSEFAVQSSQEGGRFTLDC